MIITLDATSNESWHGLGNHRPSLRPSRPTAMLLRPFYTSEMQPTAPRGFIGILSPMIPRWESVSARLLDCRAATKVVCE
jgi:hypothetical protein